MNRTEFEKYLGKTVKLTMYDNEIIIGKLRKSYYKLNYYTLEGIIYEFRVSHIKKIEVEE